MSPLQLLARGPVAAVCFAEIGHNLVCVDNDECKVDALRAVTR